MSALKRSGSLCCLLLGWLLVIDASAASFDCDSAYTDVEVAICEDGRLRALDADLARVSALAVKGGLTSAESIVGMRDGLVRRCRRVEDLQACLTTRSGLERDLLSLQLGQIDGATASSLTAGLTVSGWAEQTRRAAAALAGARNTFLLASGAAPIAETSTLLNLYQQLREFGETSHRIDYLVRELRQTLAGYCAEKPDGHRWRSALEREGYRCYGAQLSYAYE